MSTLRSIQDNRHGCFGSACKDKGGHVCSCGAWWCRRCATDSLWLCPRCALETPGRKRALALYELYMRSTEKTGAHWHQSPEEHAGELLTSSRGEAKRALETASGLASTGRAAPGGYWLAVLYALAGCLDVPPAGAGPPGGTPPP